MKSNGECFEYFRDGDEWNVSLLCYEYSSGDFRRFRDPCGQRIIPLPFTDSLYFQVLRVRDRGSFAIVEVRNGKHLCRVVRIENGEVEKLLDANGVTSRSDCVVCVPR